MMPNRSALTLIELVVVLAVLAATATLMTPLFTGVVQNANEVTTKRSLVEIRDMLADYWIDTKHVTLDGIGTVATEATRFDIDWLFNNPVSGDKTQDYSVQTRIGWRGPYTASSTGDQVTAGEPFLVDAWNQTIVTQDVDPTAAVRDVRIVSAGPDGVVTIPAATATDALTSAQIGDDIYVSIELR